MSSDSGVFAGEGRANEEEDTRRTQEDREAPARSDRTGQVLASRYLLTRKIGEGGMGEVYEAEHVRLGRRVAVKLLHDVYCRREHYLERFSREAKTLASLCSEHIVAVTDCGDTSAGLPFIVMEYLEGEDLRKLLNQLAILPISRALKLVVDACEGVKVAHAKGLVHRDIKPENLFVVSRLGGTECCKVLDFGVAKQRDASTLTRDGALIGTVQYMAPEQALGEKDLDGRVDVFALGAILYECLCGEAPFRGDRAESILFAIIHREPVPLCELNPEVPESLSHVVHRALARNPANRYQTIGEFGAALAAFQQSAHHANREVSRPVGYDAVVVGPAAETLAEDEDSAIVPLTSSTGYALPMGSKRWLGSPVFWSVAAAGIVLGAGLAGSAVAFWPNDRGAVRAAGTSETVPAPSAQHSEHGAPDSVEPEAPPARADLEPAAEPHSVARGSSSSRHPEPTHVKRRGAIESPAHGVGEPRTPPKDGNVALSLDLAPNPYR